MNNYSDPYYENYDPAFDPFEIMQALEKSGFIVLAVETDDTPRLFTGLANKMPTREAVVDALKNHHIHMIDDRLAPTTYGNFYEITF